MIHDSTLVAAAARRARARAIGACIGNGIAVLYNGLRTALRTRPLFHEERLPPGRRQ